LSEQTFGVTRILDQTKTLREGLFVMSGTKLHRSRSDKMIAGVCGGFAKWLGWSPTTCRVVYVLLSILSAAFPGILVYIILWIVMPMEGD